MAVVYLRSTGYDTVIIEGKAGKPSYIYVGDDRVSVLSADGLWGQTTFETERRLKGVHGKDIGVLVIGPGGENLVKYATITSQEGKAGGRPGMGAVMGSKNLKAVVFKGMRDIPLSYQMPIISSLPRAIMNIKSKINYPFWTRWGTMATIEWSQENSVLLTHNFKEGVFDFHRSTGGYAMEAMKIKRRGCPYCNMMCGNVVVDSEGKSSELDYENVAMLGSNVA